MLDETAYPYFHCEIQVVCAVHSDKSEVSNSEEEKGVFWMA